MKEKELKEFLYFITHNKSLTRAQKLKRDKLLARDYFKAYTDEDLELAANEQKRKNGNIIGSEDKHRPGIKIKDSYIPPSNTQLFLRVFNQDDVLKYTCHLIDTDEVIEDILKECSTEEYEYSKHFELISKHFENLKKKFNKDDFPISKNIVGLISTYLTGSSGKKSKGKNKGWSSNDIEINWNCKEIRQWASRNPHIIPAPGKNIAKKLKNPGFVLPTAFRSSVTGKRIKSFSDLVVFFKSQFHIRHDNSLRSILSKVNEQWDSKKVTISFAEGCFNDSIELFTDVDKLIQAYQKIITLCIDCRSEEETPAQIELSFDDNSEYKGVSFCIHHLNSKYKKTSKNATERIGETQSGLISNLINGLCDLYIEAEFGDNVCGIINLWNKENEFYFKPSDKNIKGVKYILKF